MHDFSVTLVSFKNVCEWCFMLTLKCFSFKAIQIPRIETKLRMKLLIDVITTSIGYNSDFSLRLKMTVVQIIDRAN